MMPVRFMLPPGTDGAHARRVLGFMWQATPLRGMQVVSLPGELVVTLPDRNAETLRALVASLVAVNVEWRARHPGAPSCVQARCRYRREKGEERFQPTPVLLAAGEGDCEDLGADLTSHEIMERRRRARAVVAFPRGVGRMAHILTRTTHGLRDPSRELGM